MIWGLFFKCRYGGYIYIIIIKKYKEYKDGVADLSAWRAQTKNIVKMWGSFFMGIFHRDIWWEHHLYIWNMWRKGLIRPPKIEMIWLRIFLRRESMPRVYVILIFWDCMLARGSVSNKHVQKASQGSMFICPKPARRVYVNIQQSIWYVL